MQAVELSVKFDGMPFPKNGHWFAVPQVKLSVLTSFISLIDPLRSAESSIG